MPLETTSKSMPFPYVLVKSELHRNFATFVSRSIESEDGRGWVKGEGGVIDESLRPAR